MPYSGASDPDLPSNVKDMPTADKKQWVAVFNETYNTCVDDGGETGECETKAYKYANGVIKNKEESRNLFHRFMRWIEDNFIDATSHPPAERAYSISSAYNEVWNAVIQQDQMAWVNDLYTDDSGMFAIVTSNGKLFKIPVSTDGDLLTLGEWQEVIPEFSPAPVSQSRFAIRRQKDGQFRWVSVSCTSVINRMGEIDSRDLFDDFVARIDKEGSYPIRQFYHSGEQFRTGQADFVGRDGYCLITSGIYDDTEIAKREIAARTKEPEYWGDSIGFYPDGEPETIEVIKGVTIPVYRSGSIVEISTLPEQEAAAWYTNNTNVMEVTRMLTDRQLEAFVKLFDGDEAAAKAWLETNAAERNRLIDEGKLLARSAEPVVDEPVVTVPDPVPTQKDFIIDDTVINEITGKIDIAEIVNEVQTRMKYDEMVKNMDALVANFDQLNTRMGQIAESIKDYPKRLEALEAKEKARVKELEDDLPGEPAVRVTYRPRLEIRTEGDPIPEKIKPDRDLIKAKLAELPRVGK